MFFPNTLNTLPWVQEASHARFPVSVKSQKVTRAKTFFSRLRRSCLRPSAEHMSACGLRNEAPRRTREKTSGTQGINTHT